jgi:hypothetical protein
MQQDVLRLDIAVHHMLAMGVVQRGRHFTGDTQGFLKRELPLLVEVLPERTPLHVRHHIEQQPLGLARVVHREDVG